MKVVISFVVFFIITSCTVKNPDYKPSNYVLDHYRNFSSFTDPGALGYLFNNLPDSLDTLCDVIKKQLIHPFDVKKFGGKIPKGREFEDHDFPTVSLMLEELLKRNENGLIEKRKPEERLVVACVHHSMLLASILRYREIPVRIRAGFAKYIGYRKDIKVSHAICEVWDESHNKWILVDPDRNKVDFSCNEFEFAFETWNYIRKNKVARSKYVSRYGDVVPATIHLLIHDLSYTIGEEKSYWIDPQIVSRSSGGISEMTKNELDVLDSLALYLSSPDKHLKDLQQIAEENAFLQITE